MKNLDNAKWLLENEIATADKRISEITDILAGNDPDLEEHKERYKSLLWYYTGQRHAFEMALGVVETEQYGK